jgi:hypothetical protein
LSYRGVAVGVDDCRCGGDVGAARQRHEDAFRISTYSIACGAGSVIALMTWLGVIDTPITTMVPVGSMLIAIAMHTNSLVVVAARRRGIHLQKEL